MDSGQVGSTQVSDARHQKSNGLGLRASRGRMEESMMTL